jgi:hypothetical protein
MHPFALVIRRKRPISRKDKFSVLCATIFKTRVILMAQPKFGAGQRVSIMRSGAFPAPTGTYSVVSVLPKESGPRQYRVRSDGETFDRIIDEVRLQAVVL